MIRFPRKPGLILGAGLFLALVLVGIFHASILNGLSQALIHGDSLVPASAIVVLSGSSTGNRVQAGARLFHQGFGTWMVISGNPVYPGLFSQDMMKRYAMQLGVPEEKILAGPIHGEISTWGEAEANLERMRTRGIHSFIVVTSEYHTRRAFAVYKRLIELKEYPMTFQVHPAPDPLVPMRGWWEFPEARRLIGMEYVKLLNYLLEHSLFE